MDKKIYLNESHPDIASEADGWDPSTITKGHDQKKKWKCALGHTWEAAPYSRTGKQKRGCPVCAGKAVQKGFNDLATTHSQIAVEAFGWDPTEYSAGSKKKMPWKCPKGHMYESAIQGRTLAGSGCPVCAGKLVLIGFNDLKTNFPDIAKEAYGWDPTSITAGARKKLVWKCSDGHVWEAFVSDRTGNHKSGCPVCSNQKLSEGSNDLLTLYPDIAKEAFGWDPSEQIAGGKKTMDWKCLKGHHYRATIYQRVSSRKQGCPYCANFKVLTGYNDMKTTHPDLARELVDQDASKLIAGTAMKLKWKCPKGHVYQASGSSRSSTKSSGCPICDGKQVLSGYNDLLSKYPEIAAEADGWDPSKIAVGSSKKLKWKCSEGHNWSTTPNSRIGQGAGCPSCAKFGYDPNLDGYFYFLDHDAWGLLQIGITNYPKDRMKKHGKLGWEVIEIRGPMDGHLTRDWETEALRYLRQTGIVLGPETSLGKFDGFSETWSKKDYAPKTISELFNAVRDLD